MLAARGLPDSPVGERTVGMGRGVGEAACQEVIHMAAHSDQEVRHPFQSVHVFRVVLASGRCDCSERLRSCKRGLANRSLDDRFERNGNGVYCECGPLRADTLLCHRSFLSADGAWQFSLRCGCDSSWCERLEPDRPNNSFRGDRPELPP